MVATEVTQDEILLEMLMRTEGKAEIVNGRIIQFMPTGDEPGYAGDEIFFSLRAYVEQVKQGRAVSDNKGFRCNLPGRKTFSPDAAFYTGPRGGMKFYPQPPVFAVEVRSEGDYVANMEVELELKRADYFAAGTLVVWDVDLFSPDVVKKYTVQNPATPETFKRGELANAEPAVPGWTFEVNRVFDPVWEQESA